MFAALSEQRLEGDADVLKRFLKNHQASTWKQVVIASFAPFTRGLCVSMGIHGTLTSGRTVFGLCAEDEAKPNARSWRHERDTCDGLRYLSDRVDVAW